MPRRGVFGPSAFNEGQPFPFLDYHWLFVSEKCQIHRQSVTQWRKHLALQFLVVTLLIVVVDANLAGDPGANDRCDDTTNPDQQSRNLLVARSPSELFNSHASRSYTLSLDRSRGICYKLVADESVIHRRGSPESWNKPRDAGALAVQRKAEAAKNSSLWAQRIPQLD